MLIWIIFQHIVSHLFSWNYYWNYKHKARDILNVNLVIYLGMFVSGINHQVQEGYRLSVS